jgi:hypothetical protein
MQSNEVIPAGLLTKSRPFIRDIKYFLIVD